MEIREIARIRTGFPEKFGIPRQSGLAEDAKGTIVFVPEYRHPDALRGLLSYSHLWLIWDFSENHREGWSATVTPPRLGGKERVGVFATRSPFRPNPLGLSCVKLEEIRHTKEDGDVIIVSGVDLLDNTPIYDIKPYLPYADSHPDASGGFTEMTREHILQVEIPPELEDGLGTELKKTIRELLRLDPRTAFIKDESRIWGISYEEFNIRFTVEGDLCRVCEIRCVNGGTAEGSD